MAELWGLYSPVLLLGALLNLVPHLFVEAFRHFIVLYASLAVDHYVEAFIAELDLDLSSWCLEDSFVKMQIPSSPNRVRFEMNAPRDAGDIGCIGNGEVHLVGC